MAEKRRRIIRGIAEPYFVREPLLVRLCTAFVDNLVLILRTAFVMGALLLVQDLRILFEEAKQPVVEVVPVPTIPVEVVAVDAREVQDPVLSERVRQALNCTYEDYRDAYYDECVKEPSGIYPRPQADPDDTGLVIYQSRVLYASLDDYAGPAIVAFQTP